MIITVMRRCFRFCLPALAVALISCGVAPAHPPLIVSEDAAVKRVATLLRVFGVKTLLAKRSAWRVVSDGSETRPTSWEIVIGGEKPAERFEAYVVADGSMTTIYRGSQGAVSRVANTGSGTLLPVLPRQVAMASALLEAVAPREPTRLRSLTVNRNGIARAYYSIYRNGYPFVSHSRFGYNSTLT